jgi:hypothetical protein
MTRAEPVHPSVQMSVRAGSDAVLEAVSESPVLRGTTSSGPDVDLWEPAAHAGAAVSVSVQGQVRHRATAPPHSERLRP